MFPIPLLNGSLSASPGRVERFSANQLIGHGPEHRDDKDECDTKATPLSYGAQSSPSESGELQQGNERQREKQNTEGDDVDQRVEQSKPRRLQPNAQTDTTASGECESMHGTDLAAELDYVALAGGYGSVGPLSVCPRPGDASITIATPLRTNVSSRGDIETDFGPQPGDPPLTHPAEAKFASTQKFVTEALAQTKAEGNAKHAAF